MLRRLSKIARPNGLPSYSCRSSKWSSPYSRTHYKRFIPSQTMASIRYVQRTHTRLGRFGPIYLCLYSIHGRDGQDCSAKSCSGQEFQVTTIQQGTHRTNCRHRWKDGEETFWWIQPSRHWRGGRRVADDKPSIECSPPHGTKPSKILADSELHEKLVVVALVIAWGHSVATTAKNSI